MDTALIFLEKQKIANCPCQVHTESRGHEWVVFRRQPDRTPTLYYEQKESEDTDNEEDDDYFSVKPVTNDEEGEEDQNNCEMDPDVTGSASSIKENLPKSKTPKESGLGDTTSSLHSREANDNSQKEKIPEREEDSDDNQSIMMNRRPNYVFKPLMYYNKHLDRYYY